MNHRIVQGLIENTNINNLTVNSSSANIIMLIIPLLFIFIILCKYYDLIKKTAPEMNISHETEYQITHDL